MPAFLGEYPTPASRTIRSNRAFNGELRLWEAAACLEGDAIDEATALALRRHLDMDISPMAVQTLWQSNTLQAGRLSWSIQQRAERLNWLSGAERLDPLKPVPAESLIGRSLGFWRQHYTRERTRRRKRETTLKPWHKTQADRELGLKEALLDLWDRPERAAERLYALFKAHQGKPFKQALGKILPRYYPSDLYNPATQKSQYIRLPWHFYKLSAKARYLYALMGLAGKHLKPHGQIRPSGRLGLPLGFIAGLGGAAIMVSLTTLGTSEAPQFQLTHGVFDHPIFSQFTIREWYRSGPEQYRYIVGSPKSLESGVASAGQELTLDWRWQALDNIKILNGAQLWHAGTLPQPIRACAEHWPRRSLAVIAADPETDIAARQLAIRLLDKGAADVILLGTAWDRYLHRLTGGAAIASPQDQLLIILHSTEKLPPLADFPGAVAAVRADDFEGLARSLQFPGERSVAELWDGNSSLRLWGGPENEEVGGIQLVKVCGGTFSMGSPEEEVGAQSNEQPRHPVTLDTFAIGRTEVTEALYKTFKPLQREFGADHPAVLVSWGEARAFCQHHGLDLPTEAQWEYAARAGTLTPWSSGANEENLKASAWYGEGLSGTAHPVGQKKANPLGLYDMHGNVWEWSRDCYREDLYKDRNVELTTIDPVLDRIACEIRSLRGGSLDDPAEFLRSADRGWRRPGGGRGYGGFRCVRAPRRQP